jgi:hypothetical protein
VGSSGFTCKCGVVNINFMRAKNCCSDAKKRWNGKIWVKYFGNCEGVAMKFVNQNGTLTRRIRSGNIIYAVNIFPKR